MVIEDDVEIGANTTIDRPAVGETRIRAGAKIDNLVQIAHGVTVGLNTLLASQVGIAGSTTIGDNVILAGQVGVGNHLTIGDGVKATGQTGITNSIEAGRFVSGLPAIDNRQWAKAAVLFGRLPEYRRQLIDLERRLAALEAAAGRAADPRAIIEHPSMTSAIAPVVSTMRRRALGVALPAWRWPWPSPGRRSAPPSPRPSCNTSASRCATA